jgi:hypothetical protein
LIRDQKRFPSLFSSVRYFVKEYPVMKKSFNEKYNNSSSPITIGDIAIDTIAIFSNLEPMIAGFRRSTPPKTILLKINTRDANSK